MLILLRAGLFCLILVAFSPAGGAQCPEGTRNNYKGECVPVAPLAKDAQIEEAETQKPSEPTKDSSVVEAVASEGDIKDAAGDSGAGPVVIAEEVVAVGDDGLSTVTVEESPLNSSATMDLATALSTIRQLREEIKDLLNRVELQRYEVEKLRGRQRDLYDDLDERLRKQERLALTVPVPVMPSVDSIVISSEKPPPDEPTPMVAGAEQLSPSTGTSPEGVTEAVVMSETQDEESPVVAVETIVTVPAPTPMVAGTDLPVPNAESGGAAIALLQTQAEMPEGETMEEPVAVEQASAETVDQVATVVIGPSATEVGESSVETGALIPLHTQENQLDLDQHSNAGDEVASVVPADVLPDEQSAVVLTEMVSTIVTLDEQDAYDQAFNMLKQSRYEEAAEEFANFLRQYRHSQLTDDAWYWMAEAQYVTRDFERAMIGFNTVVNYFSSSRRIPASRLKIGYIQYETSDYEGARETLTQLLRDFPAHRVAVSAEARLKKMDRERQ